MSRQLSLSEGEELDIAMKEMLAIKLLIQNLDLSQKPTVIRLHCDNMRCVYGYENFGCRSQYLNDIIRFLFEWQIRHRIRLEIVYVSTHDNLADKPSRDVDIDNELCITAHLLHQIEHRFRLTFTLDCCASTGTQITRASGLKIPFCSRYVEDASSYINFFNLPFSKLSKETLWIFCPRKKEAKFIDHFFAQVKRPKSVILLVQHEEYHPLLNLLHSRSQKFQVYKGRNLLQKPKKKKETFEPYRGFLTLYAFFFEKL